ncbi:hypothetical protein MNQ96_16475 [Sphingopyxis granuli]|uniref:hypothetical protein n=1 Tax=Sphingopyxis granuli TaxID=267128 RepID=UPI001F539BC8|nr:hypothetical protein [Sphingopyxis granuli]UNK79118.1 hypothetical protein MNQ96_16475 [Sphingopyxis granuli]
MSAVDEAVRVCRAFHRFGECPVALTISGEKMTSFAARPDEVRAARPEFGPGDALANIPDVHPGIAEIYTRKVAQLTGTLGDPETRLDASSDIHSLVSKIIVSPGERRGEVHATLHGSLMGTQISSTVPGNTTIATLQHRWSRVHGDDEVKSGNSAFRSAAGDRTRPHPSLCGTAPPRSP